LLLVFLVPGVILAQSGKLRGTVVDQKTKEPLIGANIVVEGTNLGAATDVDGTYIILNVPVGSYILKASYIGYKTITMSNIRVNKDYTTEANFEVPSEDVQVQTVEIIAQRPLINKDHTNTVQIKTSEDLEILPVRGLSNVVSLQASVVKNEGSNSIYVRGGRAEETNVLIDGVSLVNPLNGQASAAFSNLNQNSIEEIQVQAGGFNAEYGSAMSGIISMTTKQGSSKYSLGGEVISDFFYGNSGWGYNVYNLNLGGPVLPNKDLATFYLAIERQFLGDQDPRAVGGFKNNSSLQSWNINGKLSLQPTKQIDVKLGGMSYARQGNTWDVYNLFYNSAHHEKFDNSTYSLYGKMTHNISANWFYTLQLGYFNEFLSNGDPIFWDNMEAYGDPAMNPYLSAPGTVLREMYSVDAAYGTVFNRYNKSNSSNINVNGDISIQEGAHFVKAGFQYQAFKIRRFNFQGGIGGPLKLASTTADSTQPFPEWSRYRNNGVQYFGYTYNGSESDANDWFGNRTEGPKEPLYFAAYLQDKIEMSDLILNFGLRLDHFDAKEQVVKDLLNPLGARGTPLGGVYDPTDLKNSEAFTTISPRLGFSFPVTDRAVFHAQYGVFLQMPPLERVLISKTWEEYIMSQAPFAVVIPNPNLKPERTNSYEVGMRHMLTENAALSFTGFYKEIKDLIQARNVGTNASPAWPNAYETYENVDFGTVKGISIILDVRRMHGVSFSLNYTLSYADGTGSDPNQQGRIAWLQSEPPKVVAPLDYDRRHNGSMNIDYRTSANEGPVIAGFHPLENFGVNILTTFNSGIPYTRSAIYNPLFGGTTQITPVEAINSSTGPWNYRVDLKIDRSFKIGTVNLIASLYVINLTDAKNVYGVYRTTGEPDNTGWLETASGQSWVATPGNGTAGAAAYQQASNDPTNYGVPRMVRFGLRFEY